MGVGVGIGVCVCVGAGVKVIDGTDDGVMVGGIWVLVGEAGVGEDDGVGEDKGVSVLVGVIAPVRVATSVCSPPPHAETNRITMMNIMIKHVVLFISRA